MNVLLLTPDAVGGTLLHTTMSVCMQLQNFDRPVIGLKDLVLGIESYYSPEFNQPILRTHEHYQTLTAIEEILTSVDHYKLAKLTQYNIRRRQDSLSDQLRFYQYLNDNFFIIACTRDNLFEHALSWAFNKITNKLNVYNFQEKLYTFAGIYSNGVTIDPLSIQRTLEDYKSFIEWCNTNFNVASYYSYEKNVFNLEEYILNLPIFSSQQKVTTWQDVFGIDFSTWNQHHFFSNDIGSALIANHSVKQELKNYLCFEKPTRQEHDIETAVLNFICDYNKIKASDWPAVSSIEDYEQLPLNIKQECEDVHQITYWLNTAKIIMNQASLGYGMIETKMISNKSIVEKFYELVQTQNQDFLANTKPAYHKANEAIDEMQRLGIVSKSIPVKKQTLAEKISMVKNIDQCIDAYNTWIVKNPSLGSIINQQNLIHTAQLETSTWQANLCRLK